jgi:IS30 family transposase
VKKRRKRYGAYDSRGRLAGKRHITERPAVVEGRAEPGHWEIDTVLGTGKPCVATLVERKTGFVMIGRMKARTAAELTRAAIHLVTSAPLPVLTITADNGREFHGYTHIEDATQARFCSATPHHSWERGSNENANGLIRQYCRREPAWRGSLKPGVTPSLMISTPGPESASATSPPRRLVNYSADNPCCTSNLILDVTRLRTRHGPCK